MMAEQQVGYSELARFYFWYWANEGWTTQHALQYMTICQANGSRDEAAYKTVTGIIKWAPSRGFSFRIFSAFLDGCLDIRDTRGLAFSAFCPEIL